MADIPQVLATYDALVGVALGAGLTYGFGALKRGSPVPMTFEYDHEVAVGAVDEPDTAGFHPAQRGQTHARLLLPTRCRARSPGPRTQRPATG
jgi:hypothetical protein